MVRFPILIFLPSPLPSSIHQYICTDNAITRAYGNYITYSPLPTCATLLTRTATPPPPLPAFRKTPVRRLPRKEELNCLTIYLSG